MGVSGNSVAGKSYQIFTVSEELLAKVVEAVQAGEKEARSSGNIQSFEVFCHGFRANISLGRIMIVPAKVANDRENFPTALLYGCIVKVFGWGGEEVADLIEKKIGDSEFDEYSQADFDRLKKELWTDPKTGKEASLVIFAPNWMNSREYIGFHFTEDAAALKNLLRHEVFSAYYNPAVSSAFNALMTNVDTTKVDVTDITPKLSYPFLTENPLKQYPDLNKSANVKKATILLNRKTADDVTKQTLEPQELDVFEALDTALENSLLPDASGAQGEGGFKAPSDKGGVPREAATKEAEILMPKGKGMLPHDPANQGQAPMFQPLTGSAKKAEEHGKIAHIDANGICPGCKQAGEACACNGCTCKAAAETKKDKSLPDNKCSKCGTKQNNYRTKCWKCGTSLKKACAPFEAPFTNVGPGSAAADAQESAASAMKETVGEDDPEHKMMDGEPIGIAIDESGVPRREDAKTSGKKNAKPADNQSNRTHDMSHPETLRVGQERLSSSYSAAYNGGFVDKHDMPPQEVRDYMKASMGNNNEYAPHAVADHQKAIEAGQYGEDGLNRLSNKKWGSVTAAEIKAGFVAEHIAADFEEPSHTASERFMKKRAAHEAHLDKFRPKQAVELDIDSIWDSITEDMGPAPIVELDNDPNGDAPSTTEQHEGFDENPPAPTGRPNKKDVQDLPEAFRSDEPEDEKEISDSEAESQETDLENEPSREEHNASWRLDSKLADFVDEVYGEYSGDNVGEVKHADGENPEPNAQWGVTPEEGERLINMVQHGDRVTILRPAGRGRNGQEWAEATGRAVMHSSHGGWVLNMGGKHGTPGLADAGNILAVRKAKNQQPGLGRLGADKQADTADNGYDIDSAANPTSKETGPSQTVECHEDYNTERSEGTDRPKPGAGADIKQSNKKAYIGGDDVDPTDAQLEGGHDPEEQEDALSEAETLMLMEDSVWEQLGIQSGGELRENPKLYDQYKNAMAEALKGAGISKVPTAVLHELENENFHTLMQLLIELGMGKYASDEKMADTADNPANMGGAVIEPKTDADIKDTTGPTPINTKGAADISGDAAEAKAETVSPDTVDKDIQQPTVSVEEAAKKNAAFDKLSYWMNEYEVDEAVQLLGNDPLLGKYARFLSEFKDEVNSHSDGWAYWKLPAHAAKQLMALLKAAMDKKRGYRSPESEQEVTQQLLNKAMGPIKAFMTRRGLAAGMQMPKLANDISGDMSEAKSEVDYNKAQVADEPKATDTVNPEHFAAKGECSECGGKASLDKNHLCSECRHEAKAAAIGERNDDVPVSKGDIPNEKQPKSDLSGVQPEAHDVPPQVDSKVACGADQPESVEFDFGAGDLADIVMTEDTDESAE